MTDRRTLPRRAAHRPTVQFDLFGRHLVHNRPFDLRKATQIALGIWRSGVAVRGTAGELFFTSQGIPVPTDASTVRFHGNLSYGARKCRGCSFCWR